MRIQDGVSRVAIMVGAPRGYRIVRLDHEGECGLYVRDLWNAFGTPLAARGTRSELESLLPATRPGAGR